MKYAVFKIALAYVMGFYLFSRFNPFVNKSL